MKTKLKKWGALLCAVLALSITFTSIPVYAESVGSLEKTLDLVLVKLGVVCNENGLNTIANNLYDTAIGNVQDFDEYCTSNGLNPSDSTSYDSWKETREYQDHLLDMVMENKYRIATENGGDVTLDFTKDDMNDAIHGGDGVRRGEEYTIDDDIVKDFCDAFNSYVIDYTDYYYVNSYCYKNINPLWFDDREQYEWTVARCKELDDGVYVFCLKSRSDSSNYYTSFDNDNTSVVDSIWMVDISNYAYVAVNESGYDVSSVLCYDSQWNPVTSGYQYKQFFYDSSYNETNKYYNFLTYDDIPYYDSLCSYSITMYPNILPKKSVDTTLSFFTRDGHNIRVWKDINSYKIYTVGQQPYYVTTTYNSQIYNSVSYTGDYYCDNSNVFSYSVVQDKINNIQGDLTDSIVDSTVDQSVTNITNNYYYTSGSGGGTTDGDTTTDSDNPFDGLLEKLMDAVGNIVGLLDDVVALVLSFIADALNAIVSMVTSVLNMLTEFKEELSGLSGALGEFFPYLPEDFWTIIMGTVSVICGLAIIRYFMNK